MIRLLTARLERFRLGDKGQVLIHARDPVKAQRLLDQNIRRVGAGVQRIVQPQGDRMFPGDLLGNSAAWSQAERSRSNRRRGGRPGSFLCIPWAA